MLRKTNETCNIAYYTINSAPKQQHCPILCHKMLLYPSKEKKRKNKRKNLFFYFFFQYTIVLEIYKLCHENEIHW